MSRMLLVLVITLLSYALAESNGVFAKLKNGQKLELQTVVLMSRHGNRSPNHVVNAVYCGDARKEINKHYAAQQVADGSLTFSGLHGMWNLGKHTYETYSKSGFMPGSYNKQHAQVFAAAGYRTLISAAAWGNTAMPHSYGLGPNMPTPVFSTEETSDDLLEVRHATCGTTLRNDIAEFDEKVVPKLLDEHKEILEKISKVCDFDILKTKEITFGAFSVMDAVKDISDAVTGDFLEGFPLMPGLTDEDRLEYMTFAEDIFQARHYHTEEMDAYLTGSFPHRMVKMFDRRVSYNTNSTAIADFPKGKLAKAVEERAAASVDPLRPPRLMYAYHAHRELLYAMERFLKVRLGVDRPGLQTKHIHPSTGVFFELFVDQEKADEIQKKGEQKQDEYVLNSERSNKQRFVASEMDEAYYVRVMVWVPCWDKDGKSLPYDEASPDCPARARVLEQCGEEFCNLKKFKAIIANNFKKVGGDYKKLCPAENEEIDYSLTLRKNMKHEKSVHQKSKKNGKNTKNSKRSKKIGSQHLKYMEDENNWVRNSAKNKN